MASIGALVKVIAEVGGLDESSVKLAARYIREAGMISQGSFGGAAPRMTPRDAAHLLIGVHASDLTKNAAETVATFSRLEWNSLKKNWDDGEYIPELRAIFGEGVKFGDAFSNLIMLATPIFDTPSQLEVLGLNISLLLEISFQQPLEAVEIRIWRYEEDDPMAELGGSLEYEEGAFHLLTPTQGLLPDRIVQVTITGRTLAAIGKVLAT